MSLEIMIVKNEAKPYWEDDESIYFGDIDPYEWESLFFKDLNIMNCHEYAVESRDSQSYKDYYSKRISQLQEQFPMIARIRDYYEDALFYRNEIKILRQEILSLKKIVKLQESVNFLNQLLEASEIALKNNDGIKLVAD